MNPWTPETLPLDLLGLKLQAGPPQLTHLISLFENGETIAQFIKLVREYLPDQEIAIMSRPSSVERSNLFMAEFEMRYFPLQDYGYDDEEAFPYLLYAPDIPRLGLSWDDYHSIADDYRPGLALLFALVESPFATWDAQGEAGERVALLEKCAEVAGLEQARRIPPKGWKPDKLHEILDGTFFEGAALAADWLWHNTDTIFLDVDYEMENDLNWDRETIEDLTRRWGLARQIQDTVHNLGAWLEESPKVRVKELLDMLGAPEVQPEEMLPTERVRVTV